MALPLGNIYSNMQEQRGMSTQNLLLSISEKIQKQGLVK